MHLIDFYVVSLEVVSRTQWTSVFLKMYVSLFVTATVVLLFICQFSYITIRILSVILSMVMPNYPCFANLFLAML